MRHLLFQNNFCEFKSKCVRYSHTIQKIDFEKFLTEDNLRKCVEKFNSLKFITPHETSEKKASVLIPLCHVNNNLCLLYTLRTSTLKRHRGQISFPGGMCDNDEIPEETAIRETEEEVGLPRKNIKIYGCGASIIRSGVLITPTVGYVGHLRTNDLKINKKEVQHAFAVPLSMLCDPKCCKYTQFRNSHTLPVFIVDGFRIWGVTAFITHVFLKCLLDDVYDLKLVQNTKIREDH